MAKSYPPYVHTDEDRAAYDKARKRKWTRWLHNASDILAIKNGCWFDLEAAQAVEQFISYLPQSKGRWAGKPIELLPYQRDQIIYPLFGWKREDGTRRYRKGLAFLPKKNGKSTLGAAIALYLLVADGEGGAEVYTAAADRSNAMNVMGEAMSMVKKCPALQEYVRVFGGVKRINRIDGDIGYFQALSSDAASAEGKNIHGLIFDELHSQASRDLWRALQGGGIAREQPLFLAITTAGQSTETLCYSEYQYAKRVIAGEEEDWTYFAFVAEADPNDDPGDPKTWAKANPSLGVSPTTQALADLWAKAKGSPEDENDFKQYHLNLWVQKATSAIPLSFWDKGGEPFDPEELRGQVCYGGLDLGAISDLTALSLVFPQKDGSCKVLGYFWCPSDRSRDRGQKKVSYLKWLKDGWLRGTEGNVTDYEQVRTDINRICAKYDVRAIGTDHKFQGMQLAQELQKDGLPVILYGNNLLTMVPPTRQFMELVFGMKLHHGGNPVLRWQAGNLVMKGSNAQGNMMPDKDKSHEKIDGIVATVMALGVMGQGDPQAQQQSHYESNPLLVVEF